MEAKTGSFFARETTGTTKLVGLPPWGFWMFRSDGTAWNSQGHIFVPVERSNDEIRYAQMRVNCDDGLCLHVTCLRCNPDCKPSPHGEYLLPTSDQT